jgi:hypothetical protein
MPARASHCKHGHEFTPENSYYRPDRPGHRLCRTCKRKASSWAARPKESRDRLANEHRVHRNTYMAVQRGVRNGRLKRLPCEKCGILKTEAHHDDYSKPLDVRWLCRAHHAELHRQLRKL